MQEPTPWEMKFLPAGDRAVVIEFGDDIDPDLNALVHRTAAAIQRAQLDGVIEIVPTYRSLSLHYDPLQASPDELETAVRALETPESDAGTNRRIVELPTLYGGEYGPDLAFVAENAGMSESEVIELHSAPDYLVYTMGFSPGFPYLGGLDPRLDTPRLSVPRTLIPPGAVGIAETQTGVYPVASPGGWRLIGRTPLKLFDPVAGTARDAESPTLIDAGDNIRFVPLPNEEAYKAIERRVSEGSYSVKTEALP